MKYILKTIGIFVILLMIGCKYNNSDGTVSSNDSITEDTPVDNEEPKITYGVDLGLSVNWAECNVGAKSPEGVGYCIPFGNVTGTVNAPVTKRKKISGTDADIAVVKMGEGWRMPTGAEMQELVDQCTWQVETLNGRNGFRVSGRNGNSIFLPNTGSNYSTEQFSRMNFVHDTLSNIRYEGNYWCGTPTEDQIGLNHLSLRTDRQSVRLMWCYDYFCNAVRAVHEK